MARHHGSNLASQFSHLSRPKVRGQYLPAVADHIEIELTQRALHGILRLRGAIPNNRASRTRPRIEFRAWESPQNSPAAFGRLRLALRQIVTRLAGKWASVADDGSLSPGLECWR